MDSKKFIINSKKYKGETSVFSLRLSNDLIKKFDEVAQKTGRTRNELMALSLEFAIDNMEIK